MIQLYQFPPVWDLPNVSPFCMKLETYLRMADIPYEIVHVYRPDQAPKGKLPYIMDKGETIHDSGFVIDYLKKTYGDKLDANLNAEQKAISHLLRRTLETSFYFVVLYSRWIDERAWPTMKSTVFASIPALMRNFVANMVQRRTRDTLWRQGTGRHDPENIYQLASDDLDAIETLLGDKPFFLGDDPTSVDASAYAFLANMLWQPIDTPLKRRIGESKAFVDYCERMRARYYADSLKAAAH